MSTNQSIFPISFNCLSVEFSSWVIIFFASSHYTPTAIYTVSGYIFFKIYYLIYVFIFPILDPLWSTYAPGHGENPLGSLWDCITKVAYQAYEPYLLVAEINIFFPSDFFICRISSLTVYFPGIQDTFPLGLCIPLSYSIKIMSFNHIPCKIILIFILTFPNRVFWVISSTTLT